MKKRKISLFDVILYLVFGLIALITIYPFYNVLIVSLANTLASATYSPYLYPHVFDLTGYKTIMSDTYFYRSLGTTLFVTIVGTTLNMVFSVTAAYVLSRKRLIGRKFFLSAILFTMLFSGGMIPGYLLIKNMHLIDNRWSLILPGLISAYNVIIMRSFFSTIPESLEESARLDGANDVTIFAKIVLPLSKASIATIALFTAVGYWNDYFSSVLYINTKSRWSLQAVLRYMLTNTNQAMQSAGVTVTATTNVTAATIKAASVVVATVPILCVYPFVQKYFVKGVMIGGVKG